MDLGGSDHPCDNPPMASEERYSRSGISAGSIIAPVITLALLFVFWRLGQKWVAIPAVVFLLFFYLAIPRIIRSREARFHKQALKLLATGKAADVPALARKQILLQLFASSAPIDAKLGLAYSQTGEHLAAVSHLRNALEAAPRTEKPALQAALAKGLLVTGDPARAEAEARHLVEREARLPETIAILARARVGLGRIDRETMEYLEEARRTAPNDDVRLMTDLTEIEAALATGKKAKPIPEGADSETRFMRVWIHLVRGKLRESRGDADAARESYARAVKEGGEEHCWFADMALDRLGRLEKRPTSGDGSRREGVESDAALRRRKKKRR